MIINTTWDLNKLCTEKNFFDEIAKMNKSNIGNKLVYYYYCYLKLCLSCHDLRYIEAKKKMDLLLNCNYTNPQKLKNKYIKILNSISSHEIIYNGSTMYYNDSNYSKLLNQNSLVSFFIFQDYMKNISLHKDELLPLFLEIKKGAKSIKNEKYDYYFDKMRDVFSSYVNIKKKMLSKKKIYSYELFNNSEENISYQDACNIVSNNLKILPIKSILKEIHHKKLIDVYPSISKVSGYKTIYSYKYNSYILLNYGNTYKDLILFGHELGHYYTYEYRKKHCSYHAMKYFNDLEIPSIVNELMIAYNLWNEEASIVHLQVIFHIIFNNYYRYGIFYKYENDLINRKEKANYMELLKKYYRDIEILEDQKYEFLKIPQLLEDNYCYQYSFSTVIAVNIVKKILNKELSFKQYKNFIINSKSYNKKTIKEFLNIDVDQDDIYLIFIDEVNCLLEEYKKIGGYNDN